MDEENFNQSQKISEQRKEQRDSARAERDFALDERDHARIERDSFKGQNSNLKLNSVAQEQFLATISHDLRNPIGAIKMAADLIRDNHDDKELIQEMASLIDRNALQAGELIIQLLDAHLIKSGEKLPIEVERCDIMQILSKCHGSMAPQNQNRILLKSNTDDEIWGHWDPRALERVFKNLLSNAIKFSEIDRDILVTAWQGPDITTVNVHNFGDVITLENQLKIFESQFRVQNNELKNKKGWGLGLTLVRGIAEAHNGKIEVTSGKTEGTTFTLKIPNNARVIA